MRRSDEQFRHAVIRSFVPGLAFDTRPLPAVGGRVRFLATGTTVFLAIATILL